MQTRPNELRDGHRSAPLHHVPIVPEPIARFDGHDVDADWQSRQWGCVGQGSGLAHEVRGAAKPQDLLMAHRFLGQAEVAARPPSNLHDHERQWVPWIDADEVQLRSPDAHIAAEDRPSRSSELPSHEVFGGRPKTLGWSPTRRLRRAIHPLSIGVVDARRLIRVIGECSSDAGIAPLLPGERPLARAPALGRQEGRLRGVEVEAPGQPDQDPIVIEIG